jgi:ABC-type sugar transport system substrate-binding protein
MHPLRFFIFTLFSSITTFAAVFAEERTTTNNTNSSSSSFTFAVIPKNTNNEFFTVVEQGCLAQSALLSAPPSTSNVSCLYIGPPDLDPIAQAGYIDAIINGTYGKIDGISVSVSDAAIVGSAINRAIQAKIPTITFDSDAQDSLRRAAIGTNNTAFGVELGKVLEQLNPTGGKYGIIAAKAPNILDRVSGLREKLKETKWVEVESSWKDSNDDANTALQEMYEFVNEGDIDAIIPVGGWPMFNSDPQNWKNFVDSNRNLTLVVADTLSVQLDLMNQGYVNGLVGQLPYQMGVMSIDVLMKLVKGEEVDEEIFGTALLEVIQFPLNLPEYTVNNNYLGNLSIIAYVLVAVIEVAALAIMTWTYLHRKTRVIRASQPFFLYMVVIGVMVFASAMVFLAFDSGSGRFSQEMLDVSCMVVPWLTTLGFTTIVS